VRFLLLKSLFLLRLKGYIKFALNLIPGKWGRCGKRLIDIPEDIEFLIKKTASAIFRYPGSPEAVWVIPWWLHQGVQAIIIAVELLSI
jgi:hypothetical protein